MNPPLSDIGRGAFRSFLKTLLMCFFITGHLYKLGRTFKGNIMRRALAVIPLPHPWDCRSDNCSLGVSQLYIDELERRHAGDSIFHSHLRSLTLIRGCCSWELP